MPLYTRTYDLTAFTQGDIYSAFADRRRFVTIDNQLAFITDLIGDGVISGWEVSVENLPTLDVSVSSGYGIISRFATYTYGPQNYTLTDNRTVYFYMRRKDGVLGGFSGFSSQDSADPVISDFSAPATPTGLVSISATTSNVSLDWDDNTETDFDHYDLYVSEDNITYDILATDLTESSYDHDEVSQDEAYYYKLKAFNKSDQESSFTSALSVSTPKNLSQPLPPSRLQAFSQGQSVQLFWELSPSGITEEYLISTQQITADNQPVGVPATRVIDGAKNFAVIRDLTNGKSYRFTIRSNSVNNITSAPIDTVQIPAQNRGPLEVEDIDTIFAPGGNDDVNVEMTVILTPPSGPYVTPADRYYIIITENATTTFDPIVILDGGTSRTIRTLPLTGEEGAVSYRSLKTNTRYIIRVVGVDENGNENNGTISQVRTPVFVQPAPVSNFQISQLQDFSVFASWVNSSSSLFERNIITVYYKEMGGVISNYIVEDLDIGSSSSYVVPSNLVSAGRTFFFSVSAVDQFGNESLAISGSIQISTLEESGRPPVPPNQSTSSGDSRVVVTWNPLGLDEIEFYNIYRAEFSFYPKPSNFVKINTVPSTESSYTDYSVTNSTRYIYFVTSTNKFGSESVNPVDDGVLTSVSVFAFPKSSSTFSRPENLIVTYLGFDAILNWDPSTGAIDGYEIWRSIGNTYSFAFLDSVDAGVTTYTDEDIVLEADVPIYYHIRNFRSEADIVVTESLTPPQGSILISKVVTENGSITIDNTVANNILNYEDPVREATRRAINTHNHELDEERGIDRRIDLGASINVSNFTTLDFKTYTTTEDLTGASAYGVTVEGSVNEEYFKNDEGEVDVIAVEQARQGVPPLLFEVNPELGQITFESPLYSSLVLPDEIAAILDFKNNPNSTGTVDQVSARLQAAFDLITQGFTDAVIRPYATNPAITISMQGVSETDSTLEPQKLESLSASQVIGGSVDERQIPSINHQGRMQEDLVPFQYPAVTETGFTFTIDGASFEDSRTFYDILQVSEDILLAATSNGLLKSEDFGVTWDEVASFPTSVSKIFYASVIDKYFVLTNEGVYVSKGSVKSWGRMSGLENVKVARDIVEDASGNLFLSTDLGVYRILAENVTQFFTWEQTSLFGPRSTESYGLLYIPGEDRVIVSNELGILETYTNGSVWQFSDEFSEFKKIYGFVKEGSTIFALTNKSIYRRSGLGDFIEVADLDAQNARRIRIFESRIFVTTDNGVLASKPTADIFNDSDIDMRGSLSNVNLNGNIVPVTSLDVIEDFLFAGVDGRLFVKKGEDTWLQYQHNDVQIPSVYVNGEIKKVGVRYNSKAGSNTVSFDEKIDVTETVTVAVGYGVYIARNDGWTFQNFESEVFVYRNGSLFASTDELRSTSTSNDGTVTSIGEPVIDLDTTQFANFQFPVATEANSELQSASRSLALAQGSIERLQGIFGAESGDVATAIEIQGSAEFSLGENETLGDVVSNAMVSIDAYLSRLFVEARVIEVEDESGSIIEIPVDLPAIVIELTGVSYNATDGVFTFDSPFNKYDTMKIDILGCTIKNVGDNTHGEVEDAMELVNSGLPASLSRVYQANIVKMGIFNEKQWPGEQDVCSTPLQAKYNYPRDNSWYDVLNSTVDWEAQLEKGETVTCLTYATDAIYIDSTYTVLVGGPNGALSINSLNLDIDFLIIDDEEPNVEVKQFYEYNEVLYVVTKNNIYRSDDGSDWEKLSRDGLPDDLYSMAAINNVLVIGAENGIYFRRQGADNIQWSVGLQTTSPVDTITDPDLLFAVVERDTIYFSTDGARWQSSGDQPVEVTALAKYKSVNFVGTQEGLYKDDGTLYSTDASLSLVKTQDTIADSDDIVVNTIAADDNQIVIGLADNTIINLVGNSWTTVTNLPVKSVHKILLVGDQIWVFGYNKLVISGSFRTPICVTNIDFTETDTDLINYETFTLDEWLNFGDEQWTYFIGPEDSCGVISHDEFSTGEYDVFSSMDWNFFEPYSTDEIDGDLNIGYITRTLNWPIKLSTGVPF